MKFTKEVKADDGNTIKLQRETDSAVEQTQLLSAGLGGHRRPKDGEKPTLPAPHLQQVINRQTNN